MIRQNELMNVRYSERGSLLGIKIYSPSSECLIECVDIPEQHVPNLDFRTECREFKREDSENLEKPFASRFAEFDTTQNFSELQINDIVSPLSFNLGKIGIF